MFRRFRGRFCRVVRILTKTRVPALGLLSESLFLNPHARGYGCRGRPHLGRGRVWQGPELVMDLKLFQRFFLQINLIACARSEVCLATQFFKTALTILVQRRTGSLSSTFSGCKKVFKFESGPNSKKSGPVQMLKSFFWVHYFSS